MGVPPFLLVVFTAAGFFTSRALPSRCKAGIQACRAASAPGWRWASPRRSTYRYVLLPMAFRIIIPPLTSESMNIFKNSSVAFAVSHPELTSSRMQARRRPRAASRSIWR